MCISCTPKVSFSVKTIPAIDGVTTEVTPSQNGNEWEVGVKVKNTTAEAVTLKIALVAEPQLKADSYLVPGINYNGNAYGENLDLPQSWGHNSDEISLIQGWEYKGEPWVFSYDRGSIPSCTIS